MKQLREVYWAGDPGHVDAFGKVIVDEFIDGKTRGGPWGIMTPESWKEHGIGMLGQGLGQRYSLQANGRWRKIEG